MGSNTFTKQPYEEFTVGGDFSLVMDTDETIVVGSSDAVVEDSAGTDVTSSIIESGSLAANGQILQVRVKGGTEDGSPYKITYKAVSDVGEKYEIDQFMEVKDI